MYPIFRKPQSVWYSAYYLLQLSEVCKAATLLNVTEQQEAAVREEQQQAAVREEKQQAAVREEQQRAALKCVMHIYALHCFTPMCGIVLVVVLVHRCPPKAHDAMAAAVGEAVLAAAAMVAAVAAAQQE
ncbi:hypothetical protein QJQ45_014090 [Haematococcus lacustris]|nr:hypothetical protein QJQ45_014090 [Haematococcus lacustris]